MKHIASAIAVLALASACVPAKKYEEASRKAQQFENKYEDRGIEIGLLKKRIKQLESEKQQLADARSALEQDTTLLGMKNRTLLDKLSILENDLRMLAAKMGDSPEYRALMKHLLSMQDELVSSQNSRDDAEKAIERQKKIMAETSAALKESDRALAEREQQLEQNRLQLEQTSRQLQQAGQDLQSARESIEQQAARLREMEQALHAKDSAMLALRNTIANALVDFTGDDLNVHQKDGNVYVSLEEKLLFASGSYEVNDNGISAIRKIAQVLTSHTDINIVVEGHTDDVPYHGNVILDNWDLSVKRATAVLRILLSSGIEPERVSAAGRGETCPIVAERTAEARRKNRRTEIILAPRIDRVMDILTENEK